MAQLAIRKNAADRVAVPQRQSTVTSVISGGRSRIRSTAATLHPEHQLTFGEGAKGRKAYDASGGVSEAGTS